MCTGFELPMLGELFGGASFGAEAAAGLGGVGELAAGAGAMGAADLGWGTALAGDLAGGEAAAAGFAGAGGVTAGTLGELAGTSGALGDAALGGAATGPSWGSADLGWGSPAPAADWGVSTPGASWNLPASAEPSAFDSMLKYASPAMSAISGVVGLQKAEEMKRLAMLAGSKADPWGSSGGRQLADTQLQQFMTNPTADPAYQMRIRGAQRANAQFGQDSGAMSVAGANASTDWYNARMAQLGGLAGAGGNPAQGAQVQLGGLEGANKLTSDSLGSFGYGAATLAGVGGLTPAQQQQLLALSWARRPGG